MLSSAVLGVEVCDGLLNHMRLPTITIFRECFKILARIESLHVLNKHLVSRSGGSVPCRELI